MQALAGCNLSMALILLLVWIAPILFLVAQRVWQSFSVAQVGHVLTGTWSEAAACTKQTCCCGGVWLRVAVVLVVVVVIAAIRPCAAFQATHFCWWYPKLPLWCMSPWLMQQTRMNTIHCTLCWALPWPAYPLVWYGSWWYWLLAKSLDMITLVPIIYIYWWHGVCHRDSPGLKKVAQHIYEHHIMTMRSSSSTRNDPNNATATTNAAASPLGLNCFVCVDCCLDQCDQ